MLQNVSVMSIFKNPHTCAVSESGCTALGRVSSLSARWGLDLSFPHFYIPLLPVNSDHIAF